MARKPIVISIHGILTRGKWQKDIAPFLDDFKYEPLDFGYFWQLAREGSRQRKIEWFRDEYTRITAQGDVPSIIAHSLGTYVVASAMEQFPEIVFDRIIFSGSIVRPDFNWNARKAQFTALLNDCGKRDKWSRLAPYVVDDAGPSGVDGFTNTANDAVINRVNPLREHSGSHYALNYKKNWVPFLRGEQPVPLTAQEKRRFNLKYWLVRLIMAIGILCLAYFAWSFIACHDWPWDGDPGPLPEPQIQQGDLPTRRVALAPPQFPPEKVRLKIINEAGRNLVVWMYATEFAFAKPSKSSGFYQVFLQNEETDHVSAFTGKRGVCLFLVKGKCDAEPRIAGTLDVFSGLSPIVYIRMDRNGGYTAELVFDQEGN